jgi:pyrroline-5-carboxylate reductase
MQNLNIGFIGAGNMASSLIKGLLADGYNPQKIWATNTNLEQLENLKSLNIHTSTDNRLAAKTVDVLVLAVKPQTLKEVVNEIADVIQEKKPLLISIAVGVNLKTIQNYLHAQQIAIIRTMPNTPALLGCGATGLFANPHCSSRQKSAAEFLFRSVGIVVWLNAEKEIDIVAALSGSGPAYFFLLIHAIQIAGIELGLSEKTAALLSQQTALGAARMALESDEPVEKLKQNVTSRGGTTQAALQIFEQGQFSELVKKAMLAAKQRAEEIAHEFESQIN